MSGMPLHRNNRRLVSSLIRYLHRPQRPIASFCGRISQGPPNSDPNRYHTFWWILHWRRCPNWWLVTVNAIQEWMTQNAFRFVAHKCKIVHFTAPCSRLQRTPTVRISKTPLPVEESAKFLGLWWDSHLSFQKHTSALKTKCKEAHNLIVVVAHLKWGGGRDILLMLYQAIVRSKLEYGCIVNSTASNTNVQQLDSIHNAVLRLALGAFCTNSVSSIYEEASEAPLEEHRWMLSMHYYLWTRACTDNPAHHALHECGPTTRHLPTSNERRGMVRPPTQPVGLKLEKATTFAEISMDLVYP